MGFIVDYQEIDITDKTVLQEQLNYYRSCWNDAVRQMDMIGKDIIKLNQDMNRRKAIVRQQCNGKNLTAALEDDDEYMDLKFKLDAYKLSEKVIQQNIDMVNTDVNILRASMYSKF